MISREFVGEWFDAIPDDFKSIDECNKFDLMDDLGITEDQAEELGIWLIESKLAKIWESNLDKAVKTKLPDQYENFLDTGRFTLNGKTYTHRGNEVQEVK